MTSHCHSLPASRLTDSHGRLRVSEMLCSRYAGGERPLSWDDRKEGIDVVRAITGEEVRLKSTSMQSPPKPGWVILLTGGNASEGYSWTLYGITPSH
jgi:hypothetical protein